MTCVHFYVLYASFSRFHPLLQTLNRSATDMTVICNRVQLWPFSLLILALCGGGCVEIKYGWLWPRRRGTPVFPAHHRMAFIPVCVQLIMQQIFGKYCNAATM